MTINIESLRKMRNADFSSITSEIEKIVNPPSNGYNEEDTRIWKPTKDKAGNASATIRFLPKKEGDQLPWITQYSYGFQNKENGKWYIQLCRSTLGEKDPCNEANYALRQTGREEDKKLASSRGRRTNYYSNILVVNDPGNPDNNGRVFLFRYGKKIFEKIMAAAKPVFEDEVPCNVFDIFEGKNFKLRMRQVDGYPNYDQSIFDDSSEICGGDENKMIDVINSQYSLTELNDPSKFKSYEELSRILNSVLTGASTGPSAQEMTESYVAPVKKESTSNYTTQSAPAPQTTGKEDEDIMNYFKSLTES